MLGKIQAYPCCVLTLIRGTQGKSCLSVIQKQNGYGSIRGGWGKHFDMKTRGNCGNKRRRQKCEVTHLAVGCVGEKMKKEKKKAFRDVHPEAGPRGRNTPE